MEHPKITKIPDDHYTKNIRAGFILRDLMYIHFGSDWAVINDLFYDEYFCTLGLGFYIPQSAIDYVQKYGYLEIMSHPLYGLGVNMVGYHPNMEKYVTDAKALAVYYDTIVYPLHPTFSRTLTRSEHSDILTDTFSPELHEAFAIATGESDYANGYPYRRNPYLKYEN